MAIMTSMVWTPNSSGAVDQLRENLLLIRDAARSAGYTCNAFELTVGGGGVPGEMGLVNEYADGAAHAAALDRGPAPALIEAQGKLRYSNSSPAMAMTMGEMRGTETPYASLPRNLVQMSVIQPRIGKLQNTVDSCHKSRSIMNRLNIKVRACHVHMGSPSNRLMYLRYHDSAADWYQANERLAADGEWQDFWVSTGQMENAEIVRQSVYKLLP